MASRERRHHRIAATALALSLAAVARAEPMDLSDSQPRWVAVRFERSPPHRPGQIDSVYSPPFSAWLEPGGSPDELIVTVDARIVETVLMNAYDPIPGSFSDFVWTFDAETGHVGSARIDGTVRRTIPFGATLEAPVEVRMDTRRGAGFGPLRSVLGQRYRRYCGEAAAACTLVAPRPYDRSSGYVNAVGDVLARSGPLRVRSFSPLGEAIFSELPDARPGLADPSEAAPTRVHVSAPPR